MLSSCRSKVAQDKHHYGIVIRKERWKVYCALSEVLNVYKITTENKRGGIHSCFSLRQDLSCIFHDFVYFAQEKPSTVYLPVDLVYLKTCRSIMGLVVERLTGSTVLHALLM